MRDSEKKCILSESTTTPEQQNPEETFSTFLTEHNDVIDQAAFSLLDALAADSLEWNMEQIGDLIDAAKHILSEHGIEVCHPSYVGDAELPCVQSGICKSFMCPYWLMHTPD